MVVALSTARELGLAAVAGALILFAVLSAFVLPLRDQNFPGRRLPLFLAVTVLFFAAMMAAVVVLAREPEEEEEGGQDAEPVATAPVAGDPEAGKSVFASAACGSCHTLETAGSSGTIGPRLDDTALDQEAIVRQVTEGGGGMPAFDAQLSQEQIQDVAAFVLESSRS